MTRLRIVFTTTLSYGWVASKLSAAAPPKEPARQKSCSFVSAGTLEQNSCQHRAVANERRRLVRANPRRGPLVHHLSSVASAIAS